MKLPRLFIRPSELRQANELSESLLEALSASYQQKDQDKEEIKKLNEENARIMETLQQYSQLCKNLTAMVEALQQAPSQSQVLSDALAKWVEACTNYMNQPTHSDEAKSLLNVNKLPKN